MQCFFIMEKQTKTCPFCGEEILATAKKCKHCGEWLERENAHQEEPATIVAERQQTQSAGDAVEKRCGFFEFYLDKTWHGTDLKEPQKGKTYWAFIPAFNFGAVISRRQFWFATLLIAASYGALAAYLLDYANLFMLNKFARIIIWFYWALVFAKMLELQVRRLRDTGKSPWLVLLNFVPLVGQLVLIILFCGKGSSCPKTKWTGRDTFGIACLLFIYGVLEFVIPGMFTF